MIRHLFTLGAYVSASVTGDGFTGEGEGFFVVFFFFYSFLAASKMSGAFLATLPWQRSSFKLYAYGNSKKQDIKQGPTEVMCFVAERGGKSLSLINRMYVMNVG